MKMNKLIPLAAFLIASSALAQGPGAWRQRTGAANLDALKQYLNLTDAQLDQLRAVRREAAQSARPEARQIQEKARALREEMQSANPDQAKVGRLTVELKQLREQLRAGRSDVSEKARAILTPDQQAKLKALEEARKLAPAMRQATALGLLDPPEPLPAGALAGPMGRRAFGRTQGARR